MAWDVSTPDLYRTYAAIQAWSDQSISADTYVTPSKYEGGKVPLSQLMREFILQSNLGLKTLYYVNTNDEQDSFHDTASSDGCEECKM